MDDQNKKQIVIIVVIIIVLVLMLLGVLIAAVVTNKSSGGSLSNNNTTSSDSITTQSTMSTTVLSQDNLPNDGNNTENELMLQGIDNYLSTLKNEGRIGEYIIGDIVPINSQDTQNSLCLNVTYDSMKEYVSTVIDYVKIPGAQPLAEIEEYFADRAYASVYFSMNFDGSAYVVEEMFSC